VQKQVPPKFAREGFGFFNRPIDQQESRTLFDRALPRDRAARSATGSEQ